jgi:N-formylglutamate amidohydrolase
MQEHLPFDYLPERAAALQQVLEPLLKTLLDWGKQQA